MPLSIPFLLPIGVPFRLDNHDCTSHPDHLPFSLHFYDSPAAFNSVLRNRKKPSGGPDSRIKLSLFLRELRYLILRLPKRSERTKRIKKTTNRSFAIPTAAETIPVKPKTAAIRAMIRNVMDHPNIGTPAFSDHFFLISSYSFLTVTSATETKDRCCSMETINNCSGPSHLFLHSLFSINFCLRNKVFIIHSIWGKQNRFLASQP